VVVVEAEAVHSAAGRTLLAKILSPIAPEWLLDACDEQDGLVATESLEWNAHTRRVERVSALCYGALALEESRAKAAPSAEAAALLVRATQNLTWAELFGADGAARLAEGVARLATFARLPRSEVVAPGEPELRAALGELCGSAVALGELSVDGLLQALQAQVAPGAGHDLHEALPEWVTLPSGRRLRVHYEANQPPWVESYLQDFFGMASTPTVAHGRLPLTVHLLAPNHRPVQITTDLAGFWRTHYPTLCRALSRRYPKHAWPEDPLRATPPKQGGRRHS
jgi:ATP-dependent helicase HrpB